MNLFDFLMGRSDEEVEVTIINERNGETYTSIAANDDEVEAGIDAYREAGYTVVEEESRPWWKVW